MANPTDKVTGVATTLPSNRLAEWMAQYGPALQRYFARKVGSSAAEDLVQEVFLRLQARAGNVPAENVERYIFTTAKHALIDRIRASGVRKEALHDGLERAENLPDELSPERILEAKQDFARAVVAIQALPPRMRTAFLLHRFGRLSYSAVAKRMRISKSAVGILMLEAIERMTHAMGKSS